MSAVADKSEVIETWQDFARVTIETNDLDPMYEVIYKLNQTRDRKWMGRFTMYFLLFYDAGGAIRCAESPMDFWEYVELVLPTAKRGTERRHFRAENANKAIRKLRVMSDNPADIIDNMWAPTYGELVKKFETQFAGTQFGPYFIWKIYDIQNICFDHPIGLNHEEAMKYMPDEPRKLALQMFPYMTFGSILSMVRNEVAKYPHPVVPNRYCSYAEAETILCMLKGYFVTKTHVIGDDINEKWNQLSDFPAVRALLPESVPTTRYVRGELKL